MPGIRLKAAIIKDLTSLIRDLLSLREGCFRIAFGSVLGGHEKSGVLLRKVGLCLEGRTHETCVIMEAWGQAANSPTLLPPSPV